MTACSQADALWGFAVRLYAADGVAPLCLRLQDAYGLDTPTLLFALWRGPRGGLSLAAAERTEAVAEAWSAQSVHPLRAARRALKGGPPPQWPRGGPDAAAVESFRAQIKALELSAEKMLLAALAAVAAEDAPGDAAARLGAAELIERHRLRRGAPDAARRELATLIELAERLAQAEQGDE